jgi:hypothetical protein
MNHPSGKPVLVINDMAPFNSFKKKILQIMKTTCT